MNEKKYEKKYDIDEIVAQYCSEARRRREAEAVNKKAEINAEIPIKSVQKTANITSEKAKKATAKTVSKKTKENEITAALEIEQERIRLAKKARVTRRDVCEWFESMVSTVAFVIFIMVFVARVNQVFGISMEPTLTEGDRLIVTPLYGTLKYGDIVVLEAENLPNSQTGELGEPIVKRIIGLPKDEIYIDQLSGEVFRNGELLEEIYIAEKIAPGRAGNQVYPLTIAEGEVFVMGDNRNHSTDSRVTGGDGVLYYVGCVDMGHIVGRAVFRIYPFDVFGGL